MAPGFAPARRVLNDLPHRRLRVDAVLPEPVRREHALALHDVVVGRRLGVLEVVFRCVVHVVAAYAEELAHAPLDNVRVQEHWVGVGFVERAGLQHAYALRRAAKEERDDTVLDEEPGFLEGYEGHAEGVLVAPARPAVVEDRVVEIGTEVVVVCGEEETLGKRQ